MCVFSWKKDLQLNVWNAFNVVFYQSPIVLVTSSVYLTHFHSPQQPQPLFWSLFDFAGTHVRQLEMTINGWGVFLLYVFLLHFVLLFYSNVASAPASLVSDVWTTPPALRRLPIHLEMARFQLGDFLQKVLGHYFFLVLGFVWWKCCLTCRPITWSIEQWYPKEPPLLSLLLALFL